MWPSIYTVSTRIWIYLANMNHRETINNTWVDSHCHLDFSEFEPADTLMENLKESGCERVLVPGVSCDKFDRVIQFKHRFSQQVDMALGLHPYFLFSYEDRHLSLLETYLSKEQPVAVGEIGIDYMLDKNTWAKQHQIFEQQVQLAKQWAKPIVVHCRKAHDQIQSILKRLRFTQGGLIHGFSGSLQQAHKYLDLGFAVGLGGALTYERAKAMHRMVSKLPNGSFVLETDSPDMAPSFEQGINTPLNIPSIAQHIALLRNQDVQEIFEQTTVAYYQIIHSSSPTSVC